MGKSKNKFYALLLKGEDPELFTEWNECNKKMSGQSRAIFHGFRTEDEAMKFMNGMWRGNPISEEAITWSEEYKTKAGQLTQYTQAGMKILLPEKYPDKYCAYVDGSYNPEKKCYGFGVVFKNDQKIEYFYGGGDDKDLVSMGCGAGELLASMEAIKHAADLNMPEIKIIYDSQLIQWAYYGCGKEMLTHAASQYMYDIRDKMNIEFESIIGRSHKCSGDNSAYAKADKEANNYADYLAKKGARVED